VIEESRILAIARALAPRGGVYVEAGANDGIRQSNTLALNKGLGWSGILVEPSPTAFAALERNRPGDQLVNAALVAFGGDGSPVSGAFRDGHLTGTMDPALFARAGDTPTGKASSGMARLRGALGMKPRTTMVSVRSTTLDEVLTGAGVEQVDLLSLDVEGFELQVLRGINFSRIRPSVIVLEVRKVDTWDLVQLLSSIGYALMENLSNFAESGSATWTQDHEDFLFVDKDVLFSNAELREVLRGSA
jgi:FkbM family methyltransferase